MVGSSHIYSNIAVIFLSRTNVPSVD